MKRAILFPQQREEDEQSQLAKHELHPDNIKNSFSP